MTPVYAAVGLALVVTVLVLRGPKAAIGVGATLVALYAALIFAITNSMP